MRRSRDKCLGRARVAPTSRKSWRSSENSDGAPDARTGCLPAARRAAVEPGAAHGGGTGAAERPERPDCASESCGAHQTGCARIRGRRFCGDSGSGPSGLGARAVAAGVHRSRTGCSVSVHSHGPASAGVAGKDDGVAAQNAGLVFAGGELRRARGARVPRADVAVQRGAARDGGHRHLCKHLHLRWLPQRRHER